MRAWALGCFHSLISTQTFRRALTASVDSCAEIEYHFSGVTKSGRVWRTVPESDARSVEWAFRIHAAQNVRARSQRQMHTVHTALSYTCKASIQPAHKPTEHMIHLYQQSITDIEEEDSPNQCLSDKSTHMGGKQQTLHKQTIKTLVAYGNSQREKTQNHYFLMIVVEGQSKSNY